MKKKYFAIKKVEPLEDYELLLTFSNGEKRLFDMKPYLDNGIFKQLRKVSLFNTVHISFDTVGWDNDADFDPEVLYDLSVNVKKKKKSIVHSSNSIAAETMEKYKRSKR